MEEEAQSNRMCYGSIKMDGVGKRGMMDEWGWRKIAQSNRMCYGSIKMDGVGKRGMMDEGVWRKKHNLTECATGMIAESAEEADMLLNLLCKKTLHTPDI